MALQILNPLEIPDWDKILRTHPGYSFFHSSVWARVLSESYGYTPLYFAVLENGRLEALIPMMEVNSFLTGKRGVSLPFTDYCEPIVAEGVSFKDLLAHILDYGKEQGWKRIELRGGQDLLPKDATSETYFGHTLDLTGGEERMFSNLRDSTRRNIKRATSKGVSAGISSDWDAVKEFYRLNCMTRKQHGLPPQPLYFFRKLYDHIISKSLGFVILASHNGRNVAGAVFFHYGDNVIYKYGASDRKYQELRANNLVMWGAIKFFAHKGLKSFCFGRTEPENVGLQQFKSGWGPEEHQIHYFKYDLTRAGFVSNNKNSERGTRNIFWHHLFQRLPLSILNLAGSRLYRHVG